MAKAGDKFGFIPVSTNLPNNIGMTQDGTKEIIDIFENKVFGFPKPLDFIKYFVKASTATNKNNNDIILDFFSGSATTAHAVMQLNAEDGGNRQFICIQIPELCDEKSEAYKAGYKNICEIGKERIRRAGAEILNEDEKWKYVPLNRNDGFKVGDYTPAKVVDIIDTKDGRAPIEIVDVSKNPDVGFRVFKLDTSNLKTWDNTPVTEDDMQLLLDRMNGMIHRVKSDRSDSDMVYEIMLKLGVPLTYSVGKIGVNGRTAYTVGNDCLLLICLAEDVQPEDVEAMAEYAPAKVIIARDSFADDTAMANAHYILRDRGIELKLV